MRIQTKVRRIGNSLGIIISVKEAKKYKIVEGDVIDIEVEKKANIKEIFGSLSFSRGTQRLKDDAKTGWEK
jgi:antitoxin component of MazEF toxin-antitoxin module